MSAAVTVRLLTHTRTVGGSAHTEVNALTVMPQGRPSCRVVTMVTPLTTRRMAEPPKTSSCR